MDPISSATELEKTRVARHIARGGRAARARDVSHLDRARQLVRRLLLDELDRYVGARQFPLNHDFADLRPYFVDAHGTRCAVAHLMEISGEGPLVESVARDRNNARVRELAGDPRLLAWLAAAGLTVEEAALIQPEYCRTVSACVCGGAFTNADYPVPAQGVIEAVKVETGMARVEAIYGKTVNVKVGDRIKVSAPGDIGARVLVPVDPVAEGAASQNALGFRGISLESDGSYVCKTWGQSSPPLTKAQFVAAVQSDDCGKTLAALNSRWSERIDCRDDAGCSTGPGQASGPTSVGLLLALVSALAWRRRSPALAPPPPADRAFPAG